MKPGKSRRGNQMVGGEVVTPKPLEAVIGVPAQQSTAESRIMEHVESGRLGNQIIQGVTHNDQGQR